MTSARERYEAVQRTRHRPAHGRRRADVQAAFLLPHLRPGMRVLDIGCGPASITRGLGAVGVDLDPGPAEGVPLVRGDAFRLPLPDTAVDAAFLCAVLQHVADPLALLVEARRVCRPGAVIGVADLDWGGALYEPDDPLLHRGNEIVVAFRRGAHADVGRRLRGLLLEAGFERATVAVKGAGGDGSPAFGAFQAAAFELPEAVEVAVEEGIATADEMAAVATAWHGWGAAPEATWAGHWFEALAWAPG